MNCRPSGGSGGGPFEAPQNAEQPNDGCGHSQQSPRRAADGPQTERRKRSNEPNRRRRSKEKQRKAGMPPADDHKEAGIEKRLEELRKENSALKTRLEEQIRLNSVIVANPANGQQQGVMVDCGNILAPSSLAAGHFLPSTMPTAPSEGTSGRMDGISGLSAACPPPPAPVSPSSSPSSSSLFAALHKSEPSAFSVIRSSGRVETVEERQFGPPPPLPPPPPLSSAALLYSPSFNPFLRADNEFVRLAAQLTPFSMFPPSSSSPFLLPPVSFTSLDHHRHRQMALLSQLYGMPSNQQQHQTASSVIEPSRIAELSQPLTLDTSELGSSKDGNHPPAPPIQHNYFPLITAAAAESAAQEVPLDFSNKSVIKPTTNGTKANGRAQTTKSVITATGQTLMRRQKELPRVDRIGCQQPELLPDSSADQAKRSLPSPLPPPPHLLFNSHRHANLSTLPERHQSVLLDIATANSTAAPSLFPDGCCSSLFNPFTHLFPPKQNSPKNASKNDFDVHQKPVESLERIEKPDDGQQQCPDGQKGQKSASCSTTTTTANAGPSSSVGTTTTSMLGSLLAAPNKRHTSPTVPASRTEMCSGLGSGRMAATVATGEVVEEEKTNSTAIVASSSSRWQERDENKKKNVGGSSGSSDSEQSSMAGGGQHSPMNISLHSNNSASPSSTFPGAGSTTTICGSDRTRRGSSSPSGNSGCSGCDEHSLGEPFHHHLRRTMENDESGVDGTIIDRTKSPQTFEGAANLICPSKLKTSEELERYMDRRRRNNEAAKRCRANRRAVFEYRSRRAQILETENCELRQEMVKLNNELDQLKAIIAGNAAVAQHRIMPNA